MNVWVEAISAVALTAIEIDAPDIDDLKATVKFPSAKGTRTRTCQVLVV